MNQFARTFWKVIRCAGLLAFLGLTCAFIQAQPRAKLLIAGTYAFDNEDELIVVPALSLHPFMDLPQSNHFIVYPSGVTVTRKEAEKSKTLSLADAIANDWVRPLTKGWSEKKVVFGLGENQSEGDLSIHVNDGPQLLATSPEELEAAKLFLARHTDLIVSLCSNIQKASDQLFGPARFWEDDFGRALRQAVIFELGEHPDYKEVDLRAGLRDGLEKAFTLPFNHPGEDLFERLPLILTRKTADADSRALEALVGVPHKDRKWTDRYDDCAHITALDRKWRLYYRGDAQIFEATANAAQWFSKRAEPPKYLVFEGEGELHNDYFLGFFAPIGFREVIGHGFFARYGFPKRPQQVIFIGSQDRKINARIYGEGWNRSHEEALAKILSGNGAFSLVSDLATLTNALAKVKANLEVPWIIGPVQSDSLTLADGELEIESLNCPALVVDCSPIARNGQDGESGGPWPLNFSAVTAALAETWLKKTDQSKVDDGFFRALHDTVDRRMGRALPHRRASIYTVASEGRAGVVQEVIPSERDDEDLQKETGPSK